MERQLVNVNTFRVLAVKHYFIEHWESAIGFEDVGGE